MHSQTLSFALAHPHPVRQHISGSSRFSENNLDRVKSHTSPTTGAFVPVALSSKAELVHVAGNNNGQA